MGQKLQRRLSGSLLKLSPRAHLIPLELQLPEARVLLSCRCESGWKRGGSHPALGMSSLLLTKWKLSLFFQLSWCGSKAALCRPQSFGNLLELVHLHLPRQLSALSWRGDRSGGGCWEGKNIGPVRRHADLPGRPVKF